MLDIGAGRHRVAHHDVEESEGGRVAGGRLAAGVRQRAGDDERVAPVGAELGLEPRRALDEGARPRLVDDEVARMDVHRVRDPVAARAGDGVRDNPVPPLGRAEARVAAGGPVLGEGGSRPRDHRAGRAGGRGQRVYVGDDAARRGDMQRREPRLHPARLHVDDDERGAPGIEVLEGVAPPPKADAGLDDLLRNVDLVQVSAPSGGEAKVDPTPIPTGRRGAGPESAGARSR